MDRIKGIKSAAAVLGLCAGAGAVASTLELALVIDGSGSISSSNYALQLDAYENVFADSFYTNFVDPSPFDTLDVAVWQFSNGVTQEIGWTSINSDADALAFSSLFTFSQDGGPTNTAAAIDAAVAGIQSNPGGDAAVIDISTDGVPTANNGCGLGDQGCAFQAADNARAEGITVNALGVGSVDQTFLQDLVAPTGFFEFAPTFDDFEDTLRRKLGREIIGVPVPGTLALVLVGVLGIGAARRRAAP